MVTIGHNLGGAALFSSLHSVLAERVSSRPYKTISSRGFGDLVVLLNPAFEAIRYGSLYGLSQDECRKYPETQLPKLVILTARDDPFGRWFFPMGGGGFVVGEPQNDDCNVLHGKRRRALRTKTVGCRRPRGRSL